MVADGLLAALAILVSYLGFALLALSQERHWCAVCGMGAGARMPPTWRASAGLLLQGLALLLAVCAQGPSFGGLLWMVTVSAAAMAVAFTLAWRPTWLRPLARVGERRGRQNVGQKRL